MYVSLIQWGQAAAMAFCPFLLLLWPSDGVCKEITAQRSREPPQRPQMAFTRVRVRAYIQLSDKARLAVDGRAGAREKAGAMPSKFWTSHREQPQGRPSFGHPPPSRGDGVTGSYATAARWRNETLHPPQERPGQVYGWRMALLRKSRPAHLSTRGQFSQTFFPRPSGALSRHKSLSLWI